MQIQKLKNFDFGKEVIAVFVSKQDWMQYEFSDHSRSSTFRITTGMAFQQLAVDLDTAGWIALQKALQKQDTWIPVEKVGERE